MAFVKTLSLHKVKGTTVRPVSKATSDGQGTYYTRDIVFLNEDGESFTVRLFADEPTGLEIKDL